MSYPGQGNQPPWQRNQMQGPVQGGMPNQMNAMGMQNQQMPYQNPQIFNQNMPMQQPSQGQNMSYGQMGGNMNQMGAVPPPPPLFSQTVSYPNARGLNSMAFSGSTGQNSQQGPAQQHQSMSSGGGGGHGQQQNAVGTVTKTHSDCGFVDDEVFFHKSVCKGPMPKVGERVLVEATFNQNSTFKWNATRIQIVSSSKDSSRIQPPPPPLISTGSSKSSVYSAVPPPNEYADQFGRPKSSRLSPSRRSPDRHRREARHREEDDYERKKRREERERERERHREKRELSPERRERSPVRRPSPKRRRTRPLPRYMVQIPKLSLAMTEADVYELRRRYGNMYVPSDFFTTHIRWPEYFPPQSPFSIHRPCSFHIMHKNVEAPKDYSNLDPPDADYLFSAKVMLMATPPISEIYEKCLQDENDRDEEQHFVHPTRLISFLVGIRGKNEAMAIGGPWSPSLDGENPDKDPTVLIKTAIRNCKVLTGVDLSKCTQWYRFVELYYHRPEATHKGKLVPARTETVVIYLPDINSCMPTRAEWTETQQIYKATLERVLKQENPSDDNTGKSTKTSAEKTSSDKNADKKEVRASANGKAVSSTQAAAAAAVAAGASQDEAANEKDESIKKEPTHHSELDPKTMKIQELRDELSARNLSPKGLKPQLIARLVKALRTEKSQEEDKSVEDAAEVENSENENADEEDNRNDDVTDLDMTDIVVLDEYDSTKNDDKDAKKEERKSIDEKDRQYLERRYKLPESSKIIVHPSKTAKSGKFDCTIMSLSVLLDYRPEDAKEHSFEVSLFAELFNEMLMRDFGFNIYKELVMLPDKPKEEKKKDEKKTDEKDSDEKSDSTKERAISRTSDSEKSDKKSLKDHDREKERSRDREKRSSKSRDRDRLVSKSRNRDDESEDDDFSIISGEKRKKRVVAKPELLLSFVYFDTTHCGYIFEKDMEELLYALGLNLSRGQVRKILSKTILRDSLYYKKLTHKVNEEGDSAKEAELEIETKKVDLSKLAKGNKFNFPIFKSDDSTKAPSAKRARKESNGENGNIDAVSNNGLVAYNGGVLDVANMLEQMKRIEKEREESERTLVELKKQNNELSSKSSKAVTRIKDLQISTASLTRKLNDAEQSVSTLSKKCNEYYSLVSNIYDKITPVISKNDRILKNESVRDKDREKERDKDKDKEKEREKDKDKDKDKEREKDKDKDKDKEREKDREKTREKDRDKEKGKEEPSKEKETDKAREKDRAKTHEREAVKTAVKEVKENCTQDVKKEVSE